MKRTNSYRMNPVRLLTGLLCFSGWLSSAAPLALAEKTDLSPTPDAGWTIPDWTLPFPTTTVGESEILVTGESPRTPIMGECNVPFPERSYICDDAMRVARIRMAICLYNASVWCQRVDGTVKTSATLADFDLSCEPPTPPVSQFSFADRWIQIEWECDFGMPTVTESLPTGQGK